MKVLLVEFFDKGHTRAVLGYTKKALQSNSIEFVEYRQNFCGVDCGSRSLLLSLDREALDSGCDVIHILTIDYLLKSLLRGALRLPRLRTALVANLYNFNNLSVFHRRCVLSWFKSRGIPNRFLISSRSLTVRSGVSEMASFIPDPYDSEEFRPIDSIVARQKLNLESYSGKKIFLVFGTIDIRKGADRILGAFDSVSERRSDWLLLCVGRVDTTGFSSATMACLNHLMNSGLLLIKDRYVEESEVEFWFGACDYVVTAYPPWYVISSGNLTRACASGRVSVAAQHGEVGELIREKQLGITFDVRKPEGLVQAVLTALDLDQLTYKSMASRALIEARGRDLSNYGECVADSYRLALLSRK